MTDYSDLKVEPLLRDILEAVATEQYGKEFRAISRSAHEAVIAWLVLCPDDDIVRQVLTDADDPDLAAALDDAGIDTIQDLVDHVADGRFENDDLFDPMRAVRTPRDIDELAGVDVQAGDGDD